jgi:hypothetical protein
MITAEIDGGVLGLFLIITTQKNRAMEVKIANNRFIKSILSTN